MTLDKYANAAAARRAIRKRAQVEGAVIAYETCLDIMRDKTAASQARSAAANTVIRMGGLFEPTSKDDIDEKPAYEMTAAELNASIAQNQHFLDQQIAAMERARAARGETGPLTDDDFDIAAAHGFRFDEDDENDGNEDTDTPSAFG